MGLDDLTTPLRASLAVQKGEGVRVLLEDRRVSVVPTGAEASVLLELGGRLVLLQAVTDRDRAHLLALLEEE